ncbi:MAG: tyrosine-type recombinase/integrase [Burkholderia sp.]
MTARKKARYPRVYLKHGAWYWVEPRTSKWIWLCAETDSEEKLLERLLEEKKKYARPEGNGDMRPLIDEYVKQYRAQHREKAWPKYGDYAGNGFRKSNVAAVRPSHVSNWLKVKYAGKLPMQRVMRAFLSGFFQWCVDTDRIDMNPCKEVKLKKPKARSVYITDDHFARIRTALLTYTYVVHKDTPKEKTITGKVSTGPMLQCFFDMCYLTAQRSTDIRSLTWAQVDREVGVIHFTPSKTEDSSGIAVDWPITPDIAAVLDRVRGIDGGVQRIGAAPVSHASNGKKAGNAYGATAVRSAWDRACERAGLTDADYTVKDIRAKSATDAKRAGYDLDEIMTGLAHTDAKTTEIYLKQRDVPLAKLRLTIPVAKSA